MNDSQIFHLLDTTIEKPRRFTYPFCYSPHPLCRMAAAQLQEYLKQKTEWKAETDKGKMFGVLVAEDENRRLGFVAAYSGQINDRSDWNGFVPAVFDYLQPDGYFKIHEAEISDINRHIDSLSQDERFLRAKDSLEKIEKEAQTATGSYKTEMQRAKEERDRKRSEGCDDKELIRESQFMKAELRRMKKHYADITAEARLQVGTFEEKLRRLKDERKRKSDSLQHWLFERFVMLNARGERSNLLDIFGDSVHKIPPSGSGECCAPKLLQYAFLHHLHPVCMAEFWWGESPKNEIRHHLEYYPACRGKCLPILSFMMQGMDVDDNPMDDSPEGNTETGKEHDNDILKIVYDDDYLCIVDKPSGMISVPGNIRRESVASLFRRMYPKAEGPVVVHRLDMDTSGLMILAKDEITYHHLQNQFRDRLIRKKYVAIVEGIPENDEGIISIPLRADVMDRPRQKADYEHGKTAVTEYRVISKDYEKKESRIELYPKTGRTHQLRMHCSLKDGLACPIKGDSLYGHPSDRLYLHAEEITFIHPADGRKITISAPAAF